jgi:hypothetical protein
VKGRFDSATNLDIPVGGGMTQCLCDGIIIRCDLGQERGGASPKFGIRMPKRVDQGRNRRATNSLESSGNNDACSRIGVSEESNQGVSGRTSRLSQTA